MHWPEPLRRLSFDLGSRIVTGGFARADVALRRPFVRRSDYFDGYVYGTQVPVVSADAAEREQQSRALIEAMALDVMAQWRAALPEAEAHLAALDGFDADASARDLLLALELGAIRGLRLWEIHTLVLGPGLIAIDRFVELYLELFPGDTELAAMRLLEGEETKTSEAAAALAALARELAADPVVRRLIERTAADELGRALAAHPQAWARVRAYLQAYGRRTSMIDPASPALIDEPAPVLRDLRAFVLDPTKDPAAERQRALTERDRAFAAAVELLHGYPSAVREVFETWLHAARAGTALMETHNFYIDFGFGYRIRCIVLALGSRLAEAGLIERADDIFDLTLDELRATVVGSVDRRALVRERAVEFARQRRVTAPATIGAPPPAPAAGAIIDPRVRASARFVGVPLEQAADARLVRGHAGSSGTARGVARVVRTFADAERVAAGEILVAPTTASPWTPLFARVAAVVTDTGGSLSHCAIVAREYHIPAVVGCGDACVRIPDGALIEVNGDAGEVRVLENGGVT